MWMGRLLLTLLVAAMPTTAVRVGVISWNIADHSPFASLEAHLTKIYNELGVVDVLAVMLQENQNIASEADVSISPTFSAMVARHGLEFVGTESKCDRFKSLMHGCNSVSVYSSITPKIVEHALIDGTREKSTVAVALTLGNNKLCFLGAHFETGDKVGGAKARVDHWANVIELEKLDDLKCDSVFFGGDHNYRTSDWAKGVQNELFQDGSESLALIADYYKKLDMSNPFIGAHAKSVFPFLIKRCDLSLLDPFVYDYRFMHGTQIPPTFQPIRETKCPVDLSKDVARGGDGDKRAICFKTLAGGNCPAINPTHWCVTETRPLSWADVIMYASLGNTINIMSKYGGYYAPTPSDHAAVYGLWIVRQARFFRQNAVSNLMKVYSQDI